VTVVIGVGTVTVVTAGVVTVTVAIGVLTVTEDGTVAGSVGTDTVGSWSVVGDAVEDADRGGTTSAVELGADKETASPLGRCVGAETALVVEPPAGFTS
jgi:hypothetical protein